MTLRRVCQREAIRRRMTRVVEVEGLRLVRVDSHRPLCGHVDEVPRLYGPFDAAAIEADRRRFDAQQLADQPGESSHRAACGAARNGPYPVALRGHGPG